MDGSTTPAVRGDLPWDASYPAGLDWRTPVPERPLHSLVDEACAAFPHHPCLDFYGRRTTYRQVARLIDRAARGLQDRGVGKGCKVALLLPNCPYSVIAFHAILKAGGTVVNLNPLAPAAELAHQIDDSETELLVTLDLVPFRDKLAQIGWPGRLRAVVVARMADALPFPKNWLYPLLKRRDVARFPEDERHVPFRRLLANRGDPRPVAVEPRADAAVLQYTGGTTGVPKGTVLTHAGLYANTMQCRRWFTGADPGRERVLAVLPFFHVFGMTGVMNFALALGAELILLPRVDVREILDTVQRKRPTIFSGVPRLFQAIVGFPRLSRYDLSSLRLCVSGGDSLPPLLLERFQKLTGAYLAEGYGLTEASPVVTCNPFDGLNKPGSAGPPLPGTMVEIVSLDDRCTPQPQGRVGEICVSGPQVMAGYWKDAAATAEAMAGGHLHTGDIGFLDEDGYLHIVDRLKDLIVAGGQHVYPRAVEAVIKRHPLIADAAVVGEPDPVRGQTIRAFVVPQPGSTLSEAELRAFLADRLSRFEQPQRIEFRTALPTSTIGKILKRDLIPERPPEKPGSDDREISRPATR
ncbi:long-chain-fatty-acid--CoA ligase [Azospirillum rugosum]|uniref:Long-chain acyl-CoA synthetase n=1 Tax=Azospirillum rugosum TaxID=416170 RepID=A0ABS4SZF7_9PROT|nr:long-chain fatty acid--CoA ligase [Azospirillum rugosum]MBP2296770.1 long-chain acyl-CoA synthetase [Azospirillum rugosum]MDQ0530373.1 long-chain acyl-CoA synthetase [Azospirillum rugosum]